MSVGVPTEIKTDEYRVALTPSGVRELAEHGHEVFVQQGAGEGSAITDADYADQGAAHRRPTPTRSSPQADMVVKVKEPQAGEVARLRPGQTLFTYLHLAPDPELTQGLIDSGATCIAYETVEDRNGRLPLLAPMSEIAGKIATQAGRVHAREAARRPRAAARRRAGRGGGQGDGHRRRRGRPERGRGRDRHGRRDLRLRPQHQPPARPRVHPQRPLLDLLRLDARGRGAAAGDGPRRSAPCSSTAPRRRTSSPARSSP